MNQRLEMQQGQYQLLETRLQRIESENDARLLAVSVIQREVKRNLSRCQDPFVTRLNDSPTLEAEFIELVTSQMVGVCAEELDKLTRRSSRTFPTEKVQETVRAHMEGVFPDVMRNRKTRNISNQYSRIWEALDAEDRLQLHHENLVKNDAVELRPLGQEHIPAIMDLYDKYLCTEEEALRLFLQHDLITRKRFIHSGRMADYTDPQKRKKCEEAQLLEKLENPSNLRSKLPLGMKRRRTIITGMGVFTPGGKLISLFLLEFPMLHPDPAFQDEMRNYCEHGPSGGEMKYLGSPDTRESYIGRKEAGKIVQVVFMIGEVKGAIHQAIAGEICWAEEVGLFEPEDPEDFEAYFAEQLMVHPLLQSRSGKNDVVMKDPSKALPIHLGRNTGSNAVLGEFNLKSTIATDRNDDVSTWRHFPQKGGWDLGMGVVWTTVTGLHEEVTNAAHAKLLPHETGGFDHNWLRIRK